jgi:hypothetical protein
MFSMLVPAEAWKFKIPRCRYKDGKHCACIDVEQKSDSYSHLQHCLVAGLLNNLGPYYCLNLQNINSMHALALVPLLPYLVPFVVCLVKAETDASKSSNQEIHPELEVH